MSKQYISPIKNSKEESRIGRELLANKFKASVIYKKKHWDLKELLEFLAVRVQTLERSQCVPSAKCLFKGQQYLDDKYIGD